MNTEDKRVVISIDARVGQTAIIDFYHREFGDFSITPGAGWTLHREQSMKGFIVVRFTKLITDHELAAYFAFSYRADVEYMIDYL